MMDLIQKMILTITTNYMSDHIERWSSMDHDTFVKSLRWYRKFKEITDIEHNENLNYVNNRLQPYNLKFIGGCCGRYEIQSL
jgi:hypothetical protein